MYGAYYHVLHQHLFSFLQVAVALGTHGLAGHYNGIIIGLVLGVERGVIGNTGVFLISPARVVKSGGGEEGKHCHGIVIVRTPAGHAQCVVTGAYGVRKHGIFLNLQVYGYTQVLLPHLLNSFGNLAHAAGLIIEQVKFREALAVGIAGGCQILARFVNFRAVGVYFKFGSHVTVFIHGAHAFARGKLERWRHERSSGNGAVAQHLIAYQLAVYGKAEGLAHVNIVNYFGIHIELNVGGAKGGLTYKVRIFCQQAGYFLAGQGAGHVYFARFIALQGGGGVGYKQSLYAGKLNVILVPEILVLLEQNMGSYLVFFQIECAVGYALGGILFPTFTGGGHVLAARHIGEEGYKVKEVRSGLYQLNLKGVLVQRLYAHVVARAGAGEVFIRALYIIGYKERIGGRHFRGAGALPGILKIVRGNALAVGPFGVIAQFKCIYGVRYAFGVCAYFVAFGRGHLYAFLSVAHKTVVKVDYNVAAGTGSVQLRIPCFGFHTYVPNEIVV